MKGTIEERATALNQGTNGGQLISPDGRTALIGVQLDDAYNNPMTARPIVHTIKRLVADVLSPGVTFKPAGLLATRVASVDAIFSDLFFLFPLAGLVVFLVGWSRFRSIRRTLSVLACLN